VCSPLLPTTPTDDGDHTPPLPINPPLTLTQSVFRFCYGDFWGGSVAEWLACWPRVQKGPGSNRSRDAVGNSLRQTVHTPHSACVHQAAKLVAALLRVVGVPVYDSPHLQADCQELGSAPEPYVW